MRWLLLAAALAIAGCVDSSRPDPSPYAGAETREIKALSGDDIGKLLAGEGMGYALAAELNHYPGPKHVLDLAEAIDLSPSQQSAIERVGAEMRGEAQALGKRFVAKEAELDDLFARGEIDEARLAGLTSEIAAIEGELRAVHLAAHLKTRAILTHDQIAKYDSLRGYGSNEHVSHDGHESR